MYQDPPTKSLLGSLQQVFWKVALDTPSADGMINVKAALTVDGDHLQCPLYRAGILVFFSNDFVHVRSKSLRNDGFSDRPLHFYSLNASAQNASYASCLF